MGGAEQFIPLILIVVIMYFLMIRPQQKKQKQLDQMRKNIKRGDKVSTSGGLIGRVTKVKDDIVTIECGRDKVRLEVMKGALSVMDAAPGSAQSPASKEGAELGEEKKSILRKKKPRDEFTDYSDNPNQMDINEDVVENFDEYELQEEEYFDTEEEFYDGGDELSYDDNEDNHKK
jgi:preprotein translocase subunit YajC